jgi:outer membrane protein OmpA-like peptidoglycan-associated protein
MSDQDQTGQDNSEQDPFTWQISRVEEAPSESATQQVPTPPQRRLGGEPAGDEPGQPTVPLAQRLQQPAPGGPAGGTNQPGANPYPSTAGTYQTGSSLEPIAPQTAGRRGFSAVTALVLLLGLLATFGVGFVVSQQLFNDDTTTETVDEAATGQIGSTASSTTSDQEPAAPGNGEQTNTGDTSDDSASGNSASDDSASESDGTGSGAAVDASGVPLDLIESVEPTEENPTGAVRYAVYRNGKAFLRGFARDDEAVDRLVSSFSTVFGPNNVVNEYELNPAAPRWTDAPIYFSDAVLFDVDSAEIRPGFYPLLERTARLVDLGPFVSVKVVAMTDASGSAAYNEALAQRRADAVVNFYVDELGIDRFRFEAEVLGEERASATTDEDTAATERRVELVVSGIRG